MVKPAFAVLLLACATPAAAPPVAPSPPAARPPPPPAPPAPPAPPPRRDNPTPDGFVDVGGLTNVTLDVRYATRDNFTGAVLPGYDAPRAWLLAAPAEALARAAADLAPQGWGLVVFDAYRPHRATEAMVAWAYRTGQAQLVTGGYIRPDSYHNRGMALDVGLRRLSDGALPDMGSAYDDLSPASHTANATGEVAARRQLLVDTLRRHGWRNYHREWWHFSWPAAGKPPARDVPYGCGEAAEGAWSPPPGWDKAGWTPPATWAVGACDG